MTPGSRDIATRIFCDEEDKEEEELGILVVGLLDADCEMLDARWQMLDARWLSTQHLIIIL